MSWMLAAALLAWVSILPAENSRSTRQYSLSIARGPLASALDQFSRQTGLQVGANLPTAEQQNREVGPIVGRVTADAALNELLDGSELSYEWQDQYTVRIFAAIIKPPRAEDNVQEVLVTGSRLSGGDGPAPVRVFGREKIEQYGVSTLPNLTRYFTQQPFSFGDAHQATGAQHFQMRGLGFDTTLVLINGRRTAPSATSTSLNAFDLNAVPVTAVDRIEVMSDSASAIYGADAIGGVVNIILKEEIEEPEVHLHYGGAQGGGTERRIAVSLGNSGPRLRSSLVFDYFEHEPLIGQDRELWRNQDFRRYGGQDYRVANANPGNVYSLTGQPLPGLTSSRAAVPQGDFSRGLTPSDFIATAGQVNLDSPFRLRTLSPDMERASAFGSAQLEVSPRFTVFGEFLAADSSVQVQRGLPALTRAVVPATNPFNPFGQAVAVDYLFEGMDVTRQRTQSDFVRTVLGMRGSAHGWEWELTGLQSDEHVDGAIVNEIDPVRVQAAVNSTDPATALNLFSSGPAGSQSLLDSLLGTPRPLSFSSRMTQISAFIRGSPFALPAGDSELVLGGEWRGEQMSFHDMNDFNFEKGRDVWATFAEIRLPIARRLSLNLALRSDHYAEISESVNPQYGIVWKPSQDWLLRASYGTSFRPPSLLELYLPERKIPFTVADPSRGGAVTPIQLIAGGRPDLEQVQAHSLTMGFAFSPAQVPGLRLASNYWRIDMEDPIVVPGVVQLLASEQRFAGLVMRSPPTAEDIVAGRPGPLQSLNVSRLNFGRVETSGVDFDASYLVETVRGSLAPMLSATWVDEYFAEDYFWILPPDRVGIADIRGTIPEWRLVGTITWKLGGFGVTAAATFTPPYKDTNQNGPTGRMLPSRTLMDLQGSWELGIGSSKESLFSQTKLTLGVLNLFDRRADFAEAGSVVGYDLSQVDMTQRFGYLRLTKSF